MMCLKGDEESLSCCPTGECPLPDVACPLFGGGVNSTAECCPDSNKACEVCFGEDAEAAGCQPLDQAMWSDHCKQDGDAAFGEGLVISGDDTVIQKGILKVRTRRHCCCFCAFLRLPYACWPCSEHADLGC